MNHSFRKKRPTFSPQTGATPSSAPSYSCSVSHPPPTPIQPWSSPAARPTTVAPGNKCRLASCIDLNPERRPILPSCSALGRAGAAVPGGREHGREWECLGACPQGTGEEAVRGRGPGEALVTRGAWLHPRAQGVGGESRAWWAVSVAEGVAFPRKTSAASGGPRGRGLGAVMRWAAGPVAGARAACGTDWGRESGCR